MTMADPDSPLATVRIWPFPDDLDFRKQDTQAAAPGKSRRSEPESTPDPVAHHAAIGNFAFLSLPGFSDGSS